MQALGRLYDIGSQFTPVADSAVAITGHRVHLKNYSSATFVVLLGAVSAGTDTFVPDLQQHTAATGGTTADLDTTTVWYHKSEATLDGDETWTRVTQSAASEISLTGATYAALEMIIVFEVDATSLSDGYEWVSVAWADPGSGGTRTGAGLVILNGPAYQRRPDALPQPNA